jgi:predicted transglutaminase-like cysteine proteinase
MRIEWSGAVVASIITLFSPSITGGAAQAQEPRGSAAIVGEPTGVPYGWLDFCGRRPHECNVRRLPSVDLKLSGKVWQTLDRINRRVNAEIQPVTNLEHWGTIIDHWDYPVDGKGDCKIYALQKRRLLMAAGIPRQALLMTIARLSDGEGHTILTVKTDHGDFILDNMVSDIRSWDETGYQFVKRQSQQDPNVWVSIGGQAQYSAR